MTEFRWPSSLSPTLNPAISDPATARAAVEEHAAYDLMRLRIYAGRAANAGKIRIQNFGRAVAMRFNTVGYFNQVYHLDLESVEQLPQLEAFFAGTNHRPKFHIAPDTDRVAVAQRLLAAGYAPDHTVVRLGLELEEAPLAVGRLPEAITVEAMNAHGAGEFFTTYLDAFESDSSPAKREDALANMSRLFGAAGLWFYLAKWQGQSAGVGVLHCAGQQASLCGGATKAAHRDNGVHAALIAIRLKQARALGAEWVSSWADKDGASHRNLLLAGFSLLYEDSVWMTRATKSS